ncbi:MAG TPA: hypothetical protein ENN80_02550, partial [Candidatus Hydrogenedentes bacterium]|nr:hypothetical protein [Candidatus Hydrogenedentota bacterium]
MGGFGAQAAALAPRFGSCIVCASLLYPPMQRFVHGVPSRMSRPELEKRKHAFFDLQRRVVAHKTVESWQEIPHAGVVIDLDLTEILRLTALLREEPEYASVHLTLNSVMLKFIAVCLQASPEMNAHVAYNAKTGVGELTTFKSINIATPMRMPDGRMLSPVVRGLESMTLPEVCAAMVELKRQAANTNIDFLLREAAMNDTWERIRKLRLGALLRLYPNLVGRGRLPSPNRREWKVYEAIPKSERITPENLLSATALVSNIG